MALDFTVLKKIINENDRVLVGVSGGADSMCLLDLVYKFSKVVNFDFFAVHVNHGIRGEEALRDENFVKDFCEKREIRFICEKVNAIEFAKKHLKTLEQAARELRYNVFDSILTKLNADKLLVAHHKDDQAETVLMHILRGSSLKGARGMLRESENIRRPLLNFSRVEIEEYNNKNDIEYLTDSTNFDSKYTRNYLRNIIMPALKEIYPNVTTSLCSFAEKCTKDEDFICQTININRVKCKNGEVELKIKDLGVHYSVASRLIKRACEELNVFADIEEKHINDIIKIKDRQNGKSINLPHDLIAYKNYDSIILTKNRFNKTKANIKFKVGEQEFPNFGTIIVEKVREWDQNIFKRGELFVDLQKIPQNAVWRCRKTGDVFKKFGSGDKNLSEFLSDRKIAKTKRDVIPVLASEDKILVVIGEEISENVKITEKTKNIGKITFQLKNDALKIS